MKLIRVAGVFVNFPAPEPKPETVALPNKKLPNSTSGRLFIISENVR